MDSPFFLPKPPSGARLDLRASADLPDGHLRRDVRPLIGGHLLQHEAVEADPVEMSSEAASEKRRGRPLLFSEKTLREAATFSHVRRVRTRRGAQDLVYRKFAIAVLELFSEAHTESAGALVWLLEPTPRHSLLSELGRVGAPTSDAQGRLHWNTRDVNRLVRAALEIAEAKPPAKLGVAMIRDLRRRYRDAGEDEVLGLRFPSS